MPTFTISVNAKTLGTYVVKKSMISIGRSRTNTISIASKAVSRNHVRIEKTADGWAVADLGSLNGTYVNDIRINSAFLSEGDRITVGAYVITFSPEPALAADSTETHVAAVQAAAGGPDGTDAVDVHVESEGVENVSAVPPKEQTDVSEAAESAPQPPKTASIPVQSVVEEMTEGGEVDRAQAAPVEGPPEDSRKTDHASLPLEEKMKIAIGENPLADETWLRNRLGENDFGEEKISKQQLRALLKRMGLDSAIKRYHFFMNS